MIPLTCGVAVLDHHTRLTLLEIDALLATVGAAMIVVCFLLGEK